MEIDKLGQFPILQFFGGLMIFLGGACAIFKGFVDKKKADAAPVVVVPDAAAQLVLFQLRRDLEEVMRAHREAVTESMRRDRHEINNRVTAAIKELEADIEKLQERIHQIELGNRHR